jgi:hypothetical protein
MRVRRGERVLRFVLELLEAELELAEEVRCFWGDAGAESRRARWCVSGVAGRYSSSRSVSEPDSPRWSCVRARRSEGRMLEEDALEEDVEVFELELELVEWELEEVEWRDGGGEATPGGGRVLGEGELRREKEESLSSAWMVAGRMQAR